MIVTQYGTYGFGPLECEDRAVAASSQLYSVIEQLDLRCNGDDDCETIPVHTDCFDACDAVVSLREDQFPYADAMSSKELLEREIARIDASCSTFAQDCGAPESGVACPILDSCSLSCEQAETVRCID